VGKLKIAARERNPFFGHARIWLEQMSERDTSAQAGAIIPVELKEMRARGIAESF
jgi:hypothetical protein